MGHVCPDCGLDHETPAPPAEEIAATEARAIVKATEAEGASAAEVARIEGQTAVQLERERRKTIDAESEAELERLRARVEVLEAAAAPPEPEPVPVVVDPPAPPPEPVPDVPPPPEMPAAPKAASGKGKRGWWSAYG
jgi:hypothetical protein